MEIKQTFLVKIKEKDKRSKIKDQSKKIKEKVKRSK